MVETGNKRCRRCGKLFAENRSLCATCLANVAARTRERTAARRAHGLCTQCGRPCAEGSAVFCADHKAMHNARQQQRRAPVFPKKRGGSRTRANHQDILRVFAETDSMPKTAKLLGYGYSTVQQVIKMQAGVCRRCPNQRVPGRSYCASCLALLRDEAKRKNAARVRAGLCMKCDNVVAPPSKTLCATHRLIQADHNVAYRNRRKVHGAPQTLHERMTNIRQKYGDVAVETWTELAGNCAICGINYEQRAVHIHHIDGSHKNRTRSNFTLLCQSCHRLVHLLISHPDPGAALSWVRAVYPARTF